MLFRSRDKLAVAGDDMIVALQTQDDRIEIPYFSEGTHVSNLVIMNINATETCQP